jgi:hypothetical protein
MPAPWYRPFKKAFRSFCYLLAHTLVAVTIIAVIEAIRAVIEWFGNPKLFDFLPLRYIFDAVDVSILTVFLIFGTAEAIREFKGDENE